MESLMAMPMAAPANGDLFQTMLSANARLMQALAHAQGALSGECVFDAAHVLALRAVLEEIAPVIARSAELRRQQPQLGERFDIYRSLLLQLQHTMEQIRVTLLVQRASLDANRAQTAARSQWIAAFQRTR